MGIPRTDNPKVIEHIKAQGFQRNMYSCGCILAKDDTIMLCQWHDGYDEGLAEAAFDQRADRDAIIIATLKSLDGWIDAEQAYKDADPDTIIAAAEETP